jgi:hypothetical protein
MHQFGPLHVSPELRILIYSTKHVSDSTMSNNNTKAIVYSLQKLSKMYYIIANHCALVPDCKFCSLRFVFHIN